ncbi:hypothetical protein N2152v2_010591 [Parachlorella kessleri]
MRGIYNSRVFSLFRLLADASYTHKLAAVGAVAAFAAAREAAQDAVPPTGRSETSIHGRVKLVAPPGLNEKIASQLTSVLNRLITAAEEHADSLGFGHHIKGLTWNLVIRKNASVDASTLDGTIYLNAGLVGMLWYESSALQTAVAGIMAHELGHNLGRHVLENQLDFFLFRWTLPLRAPFRLVRAAIDARGLPSSDWVDRWHDEEVAALCRQREHEADELAVSILARAGFPPDSLARTLPLLDPLVCQHSTSWLEKGGAAVTGWARKWYATAGGSSPGGSVSVQQLEQPQMHLEKGVRGGGAAAAAGGAGGSAGLDTHPSNEERMARMLRLAAAPDVQQLYLCHPWWTRLRLRWQ